MFRGMWRVAWCVVVVVCGGGTSSFLRECGAHVHSHTPIMCKGIHLVNTIRAQGIHIWYVRMVFFWVEVIHEIRTRLRREGGAAVGDGDSCQGANDPLVTAAAFELVQVLTQMGIVPREINISFAGGHAEPASQMVNIELPSLTDPVNTQPKFPGLQGVFALFSEEEEALDG